MGTAARLVIHTACSLALLAGCGVTASPSVGRPYDTRPDEPYPPLEDVYTPPEPDAEAPPEDSSPAPDAPASDAPSARPEGGPPYPVLLHHGFAGFRDIGPLNYFYNVARDLRSRGETVYESEVSPFLPPERRAYELAMVVDRIRRETGRDRVVLIGHSQGGLDARYMISTMGYGSRVAVLATVATPHRGTYVADALLNRVPSLFDPFLSGLLTVIGFTYNQVGTNAEARATLEGLSEARAEQFNRDNPDDPSVVYWSWTGRSNRRRGDSQCGGARYENDPARVDDINPLLSVFASVLEQGNQELHVNDGMVEVRSARWGLFMGCVPADHFDEVGQIAHAGAVPGSGFDHLVFYRSIVQQARDAGF